MFQSYGTVAEKVYRFKPEHTFQHIQSALTTCRPTRCVSTGHRIWVGLVCQTFTGDRGRDPRRWLACVTALLLASQKVFYNKVFYNVGLGSLPSCSVIPCGIYINVCLSLVHDIVYHLCVRLRSQFYSRSVYASIPHELVI